VRGASPLPGGIERGNITLRPLIFLYFKVVHKRILEHLRVVLCTWHQVGREGLLVVGELVAEQCQNAML
jgi:xylose isomerase